MALDATEHQSNSESHIEIIDLEEFFNFQEEPKNVLMENPLKEHETNNEFDFKVTKCEPMEQFEVSASEPMTVGDEDLYSNYLNGSISFEDLMKNLHKKTTEEKADAEKRRKLSKRPSRSAKKRSIKKFDSDSDLDSKYASQHRSSGFLSGDDENESRQRSSRRRSKPGVHRKKWDLKIELANYLGEAERHLNNGSFEKTEEICRNIISSAPQASAPFVVLSDMFYRRGMRKESQENMLQAAERNPKDVTLWMPLVDFAEEDGDYKQAIIYARNGIKVAKNDPEIRDRLVSLLVRTGQEKESLRVRLTALLMIKNPNVNHIYAQIVKIAEEFAMIQDVGSCIRTYELAFEKLPHTCPVKDQLRVLSLLEEGERPEESLKFLLKYWGASLICENGDIASPYKIPSNTAVMESIRRCDFSCYMQMPILIKFCILMLRYNLGRVIKDCISEISTRENLRKQHLQFFELAKACKSAGLMEEGLKIAKLLALYSKCKHNPTIICLLGDLQVEAGRQDDALSTYRHIINRIDPRCTEARLALGNLLRRLGQDKEALEVLEPYLLMAPPASTSTRRSSVSKSGEDSMEPHIAPPPSLQPNNEANLDMFGSEEENEDNDDDKDELPLSDDSGSGSSSLDSETAVPTVPSLRKASEMNLLCNDPSAMRLAFERCRLLDTPANLNQFIDEACRLLFSDVMQIYLCERPSASLMFQYYICKNQLVRNLTRLDTLGPASTRVTSEDLWMICLRVIEVLIKRGDNLNLDKVLSWASVLPWVVEVTYRRRMTTHLYISNALQIGHGETAMEAMRQIEREFCHLNQYWNLLNMATTMSRELRLTRFLLRRIAKDKDNLAASLMSCGDCMARGSSRYSIALMADLRSRFPKIPLVSLLLAICFLNISVHKHLFSRHQTILQCIGFLSEYRELRGECQEVYYNIARACQQCMLGHIAIPYYEKVLQMKPVGNTESERKMMDLRMEAAYNLQLIYRHNKNPAMARYIMQKHIIIV